ncbi:MAG: sigma-70 family RNA polymerase sigma factor [Anaerolineae bacterium]|nr:sigma-70 family RNA polymerase sigma factor [Anaerolineae bacterium]
MEDDFLSAAQKGDEAAITQLVETYQQSVFNVCYRMLGDAAEAEDATQEALVKAITNLHSYDIDRPFKPWILRIASNGCIDRIRRRKNPVSLDGMGEDGAWEWKPGDSPNPEAEYLRRERQAAVRAVLDGLSPTDRMVITLFYWEGLPYTEIHEVTGLTVSAIKSRLFRARRTIGELLVQEEAYA